MTNAIEDLSITLSRLPAIGKKTAMRIACYLLKADKIYIQKLSTQIARLQDDVHTCTQCGSWTFSEGLCPICEDPTRDKTTICVVENPTDVQTIEDLHEYKGLYHVLGGVIDLLSGITPQKLSILALINRVKENDIREVIIATNPTTNGNTTALYIKNELASTNVKVTRLALGLPMGGDIGYADKMTITQSLKGRMIF